MFEKFWEDFIEFGGYKDLLIGLKNTGIIAVVGLMIGILIGTLIAVVRVAPKYKWIWRFLNRVCNVYIAFFRGTPIVVQLLLMYYVIPLGLKSMSTCILVFGLNSGAYVSEIMRSGIQSVDAGQLEAARALGLSFPVSMLKIVVPQAIKNILPTLGNEFIALIKETSVISFVACADIYVAFNKIASGNYEYVVPYLMMALVYIIIVTIITFIIRALERRFSKSDRNSRS